MPKQLDDTILQIEDEEIQSGGVTKHYGTYLK